MKNTKLRTITIAVLTLLAFSLLFSACENTVGLGKKLDMEGPKFINITEPSPVVVNGQEQKEIQVDSIFTMTGMIKDESEIVRMEIQVVRFEPKNEEDTIGKQGREWRYKNKRWEWKKDKEDGSWQSYDELGAPTWTVSDKNVQWSIPITLEGFPKGDLFFTLKAWDVYGNSDAASIYKLTVLHDNLLPELNITQLNNILYPSEGSMNNPNPPEIFNTYIFDTINEPSGTNGFINKWISHTLEFGWEIDKEIIGEYSMVLEITNKYDLTTGAGKKLYYRYEWPKNDILPRRGMFTNSAIPPRGYTKVKDGIPVTDLVPRDDLTGVPTGETLPTDVYVPMQIVVYLTDGSGKSDPVLSKGWFPYRPKADEPWVDISFAYKEDPKVPTPDYAADNYFIRQGQTVGNNVYDNIGVSSLTWKLYRLPSNTHSLIPVEDGQPGSLSNPFTDTQNYVNQAASVNWDFIANRAPGPYKIVITVKDNKLKEGDAYTGYFSIESNSTPSIKSFSSPINDPAIPGVTNATLFGDTYGNFEIRGIAQIEDLNDSLKVNRVTVAWIKPNDNSLQFTANALLYEGNRNYENWDKAIGKSYYEDAGSKVWEIPAGNIIFDTTTQNNSGTNKQEEYAFNLSLNLINDLNIKQGGNKTGPQTFIIRVYTDGAGRPKSSANNRIASIGDNMNPSIEITQILYHEYKGSGGTYEPVKTFDKVNDKLPIVSKDDKIQIKGTWNDDSKDVWTGLSVPQRKAYFNNLKILWAGAERTFEFEADFDLNGTWQTTEKMFKDLSPEGVCGECGFIIPYYDYTQCTRCGSNSMTRNNNDAMVRITAGISDHNDKSGQDILDINIETDNPSLTRITSSISDGEYGESKDTMPGTAGDQNYIDIVLDFNKHVRFYDNENYPYDISNPAEAPYLTLNNGGKAFYLSGGSGDTKITFRYFVDGKAAPVPNTSLTAAAYSGFSAIDIGGNSTPIVNGKHEKLNVTAIVWRGSYNVESLISYEHATKVAIKSDVYTYGNALSLSGQKNIVIDKIPPKLSSIVSTAGSSRNHGKGSTIYITANFDEPVNIASGTPSASDFHLKLKGGNLLTNNAQAGYSEMTGTSSISFLYEVLAGHDTSASTYTGDARYLGIDSMYKDTGVIIKDTAGNEFTNVTVPSSGLTNSSATQATIRIDTVAPNQPEITGIIANSSSYGDVEFTITGLESADSTVEYSLNYDPAKPSEVKWVGVNTPLTGSSLNNYSVTVPILLNGTYNVTARQYDNATNPNPSIQANVVQNVKVDRGALISRLGSSTADGIYGTGSYIEVDVVFRIPLYTPGFTFDANGNFTGSTTARLRLRNDKGTSSLAEAELYKRTITSTSSTYTFRFQVTNQTTKRLDVLDIDFGNLIFRDADNTGATNVNGWINILNVAPLNEYRLQKNIEILSGNPSATAVTSNSNEIRITFDRDIYKGDTENKFTIIQIPGTTATNSYRIPAVLSEARWSELFEGRTDLSSSGFTSSQWETLGKNMYYRGSNGADVGTGNTLKPDTVVKRVLNYDIQTTYDASGAVPGTSSTYAAVRTAMRNAEALSFFALDKEVSIEKDTSGNPRILRISLAAPKPLPVKGATYTYTVPCGFVKDFLEKPNGGSISGNDTTGSLSGTLQIADTGIENPVIRINKGLIETITGTNTSATNDTRHARQPLMTQFKIDSRTPGSSTRYRTRNTVDHIGRIIMRGTPGDFPNKLPNIGNQAVGNLDSFNATKRRPQSGGPDYTTATGLNHWTAMAGWGATYTSYTNGAAISIGTNNYNDGGMEYHIHVQAQRDGGSWPANVNQTTAGNSYEAAFRSVFVFSNIDAINNNNSSQNLGQQSQNGGTSAPFQNLARTRAYIRGGDKTSGDATVPDFPIGRDRSIANKARLMTPLWVAAAGGPAVDDTEGGFGTANYTNGKITDGAPDTPGGAATTDYRVPTNNGTAANNYSYEGRYLWVWVTWGVNQYAYVDLFTGEMAGSEAVTGSGYSHHHVATKDLYGSWTYSKEHYCVIPGRTTIVESRNAYGGQIDGGHQPDLLLGAVVNSPTPFSLKP